MLTVQIEEGEDQLGLIQQRIDDPRPALDTIASRFRAREQVLFASSGRGAWAPLHPDTIKAKGSGRVLVHKGVLQASLTRPGARFSVTRYRDDELLLGTRNPVARLHRRGARGMPERDPVPTITSRERAVFGEDVADYVITGVTRE